jgi:alpha-L-arabinofuranosidase
MKKKLLRVVLITFVLSGCLVEPATAKKIAVTVQAGAAGRPISPDLFGIFFEDLNYAADGGLYAELIQNCSFEYQTTEQLSWNAFTAWEYTARDGAQGSVAIDDAAPIHPNNPHYVVLHVAQVGSGVGLVNPGFDGIPVKADEKYNVSLFARQLYMGNRWGAGSAIEGKPMPLVVRLESKNGDVLGEAAMKVSGRNWTRLTATLTVGRTEDSARLVILAKDRGGIAMDMISLFPSKTFHNRPNGLRADLAQALADLQPKFVRFPGGCLVHGNGLGNIYRWKDTIGPLGQRREQANLWGYHQSVGLGYFEYFQFCEDIGAKPLPVVPAGVSCQNSGHTNGTGQQAMSIADMPAYIQDILDLIEWANGPATSTWGAKRAEAGHPEPFNLQYLGVGNEDAQTPAFRERFKMIYDAVKAKYPQITVIGTVGPSPNGRDFDEGWKFANMLGLEIVDEHYYEKPDWFLANLGRYNTYDRSKLKVYVGEYASKGNTLANALAEAAYMTGFERNGDIVHMASYAPLLAKLGHTQWNPDLIYFTNTRVIPTINYYVQQMFSTNSGDTYLPTTVGDSEQASDLVVSCVWDSKTNDLILKLVNVSSAPKPLRINLSGTKNLATSAVKTMLSGDPGVVNDAKNPRPLIPETSTIAVGPAFDYEAPSHSLTVIRIRCQPL